MFTVGLVVGLLIFVIKSQTGPWSWRLSSEDTRGYLLAAAVTRATPPRQSPAPRPEVRAARSQQQLDHVLKQREGENYEALSLGALVKCSLNSL